MSDNDLEEKPTPDVPRGILFFAALAAILIAAFVTGFVVQKIRVAGSALKEDWQYVEDIRARDAATVAAEKTAGAAYIHNVSISLAAERLDSADTGPSARISGTISNSGPSDVVLAKVTIAFYNDDPAAPVDTREILLIDATANSVRSDRALGGSEVRPIEMSVEDIKPAWTTSNVTAAISEVWIRVPPTP